jgi:hypothetical protein
VFLFHVDPAYEVVLYTPASAEVVPSVQTTAKSAHPRVNLNLFKSGHSDLRQYQGFPGILKDGSSNEERVEGASLVLVGRKGELPRYFSARLPGFLPAEAKLRGRRMHTVAVGRIGRRRVTKRAERARSTSG